MRGNRVRQLGQNGIQMPKPKAKPRVETNRVLVTGGAGFVGSHLCTYLVNRGDHVRIRLRQRTALDGTLARLLELQSNSASVEVAGREAPP